MIPFIADLRARAARLNKKIALPEGHDVRTIRAAAEIAETGLARPVVIGKRGEVEAAAQEAGVPLASLTTIDPASSEKAQAYAQMLFQRRKHKGMTYEAAREAVLDPLVWGALMVRAGDADGSVAGADTSSADVVRTAIQVLGVAEGSALVSSLFLMVLPDGRPLTYADCGVVPQPDARQLASIGIDAARNHRFLTGQEPRVAFLSFSTKGSADHPDVTKVREAVEIARGLAPDLVLDGDLQFDAAFVPSVAERKAPGSPIQGDANVFVFPDLDAGNIAYKITQRLGGAEAFGPILQGVALAANDLSRGADAEDIVNVAAITALQASLWRGRGLRPLAFSRYCNETLLIPPEAHHAGPETGAEGSAASRRTVGRTPTRTGARSGTRAPRATRTPTSRRSGIRLRRSVTAREAHAGAGRQLSRFRQATVLAVSLTAILLLLVPSAAQEATPLAPEAAVAEATSTADTLAPEAPVAAESLAVGDTVSDTVEASAGQLAGQSAQEASGVLRGMWVGFIALLPKLVIAVVILVWCGV